MRPPATRSHSGHARPRAGGRPSRHRPPDTAKEKPQEGMVVAVGNGKVASIEPDVKPGDRILFGKYSGSEVTVDNDEYVIMRKRTRILPG